MTTFAVTDPDHTIDAINYLLSNLNTAASTGNVVIPGNVLVANTTTGVVSQYGNTAVFGYLYQYVNLRYSNNATGGSGSFSTVPTNANYFGVFNSVTSTPSANPTDYQFYEVAGGFGTTKILYYSAIGGRQVAWAAANSAPSSSYVASVANVAIDLDVVTTAAGTPGERGPVVMAGVIATADPNTATSATLTTWFEAPRDAVTAPIGTGLIPVVGDTASFTWAAGAGQPQAAYSYNGSIWVPVSGQVISGNVIVRGTIAGNAMIANTITATQIAAGTITATQIAAGTITATQIAANTITAGQIAANTITGNNIAAGTITTNNFTANTIQGNIIAAGTITANQLAANAITANTVVSSGAVLGSNASLGFWLDGPTGNARFGNSISIGTQLTVGSGANIGASLIVGNLLTVGSDANIGGNLIIGSGANIGASLIIGNSATIGNLLTVGSNANIGGNLIIGSGANIGTNLRIGNSATIGNSVTIGTNLIVGANANIGGNLFVSGLVTSGTLNANTVSTPTIITGAVSSFTSYQFDGSSGIAPPASNVWVTWQDTSSILTLTTIQSSQTVFIWFNAEYSWIFTGIGGAGTTNCTVSARLIRRDYPSKANVTPLQTWTTSFTMGNASTATPIISPNPTNYVDTVPTAGTYQYMWQLQYTKSTLSVNVTSMVISSSGTYAGPGYTTPLNLLALALKR